MSVVRCSGRPAGQVVALVGALVALAGCGAGRDGIASTATGSLPYAPSLARARAVSTAIVEGIAGAPVADTVRTGPAVGTAFTRTPLTITKVLSGEVTQRTVTIHRFVSSELDDAPLLDGERYLLFLSPTTPGGGPADYGVSWGVGYRLQGDRYVYDGAATAGIPASLSIRAAERLAQP